MTHPAPHITERLEDLCQGDREAATWLYDELGPPLFRRLKQRYIRLGLDPDDLLQDAFVFFFRDDGRVLRRFLDETPEGSRDLESLESFLWNQACGIASNRLRSRRRDKSVPIGEAPERFGGRNQEKTALAKDTLARLEECLAKGAERTYLYFKLRFCDGLSPEQIRETTGWEKKVVYKLRDRLNEAVDRCAGKLGLRGRSLS